MSDMNTLSGRLVSSYSMNGELEDNGANVQCARAETKRHSVCM